MLMVWSTYPLLSSVSKLAPKVIKDGERHLVDRAGRRDLSIFQIGLRSIERRLTNARRISIRLIPFYGFKLSGG